MSHAFKNDPTQVSQADFWDRYQPKDNPNSRAQGLERVQFFPDNSTDFETVKSYANKNQVWTWVTNDEGREIVIAGFWGTGALMYFITQEPWESMDLWLNYPL